MGGDVAYLVSNILGILDIVGILDILGTLGTLPYCKVVIGTLPRMPSMPTYIGCQHFQGETA